MTWPIGMIPFANMAPYRAAGVPSGCHFVDRLPAASVAALAGGRVLAAAAPIAGVLALGDTVEALGPYGIAASLISGSVLLRSRLPLTELAAGARIHLTSSSATSVRALVILWARRHGWQGLFTPSAEADADAELVIGDEALRDPDAGGRWPVIEDLATWWHREFAMPLVFAQWVVRRDAPPACRTALRCWLGDFAAAHDSHLASGARAVAPSLGLDIAVVARYLGALRFVFDATALHSIDRFTAELRDHSAAITGLLGPLL